MGTVSFRESSNNSIDLFLKIIKRGFDLLDKVFYP